MTACLLGALTVSLQFQRRHLSDGDDQTAPTTLPWSIPVSETFVTIAGVTNSTRVYYTVIHDGDYCY